VKVKQLSELVEKHKVDILMLQETDIKGRQRAEKFQMKNFVTILPLVKEKQKVRVMTLVRDSLSKHVKVREDLMSQKITSIWIEVKKQKSKGALIGNFYREWKGEDQEDLLVQCQKDRLQMFGQQVQKAVMSKSDSVILVGGDFNIDINKMKRNQLVRWKTLAEQLSDDIEKAGMHHIDMGETHQGHTSDSSLDYYLVSDKEKVSFTETLPNSFSDHRPIKCGIDIGESEKKEIKYIFKRTRLYDEKHFKEDLKNIDWDKIRSSSDVNEKAAKLEEAIMKLNDKHFKIKKVKVRKCFRSGLSKESKDLMKERDSVRVAASKMTGKERQIKLEQYRCLRNKCVSQIRKDDRDKIKERLKTENVWTVANDIIKPNKDRDIPLIENGVEISDDKEKANILNKFFVTKIEKLRDSIDPQMKKDPFTKIKQKMQGRNIRFHFRIMKQKEIKKIIKKMKSKESAGLDGISMKFIKEHIDIMTPVLTDVINASLMQGTFPEIWKMAKVTALFKNKGERCKKENYRPISMLKSFSKVLESVVDSQIRDFVEKHGLLGTEQHGFRKHRSTNTALLNVYTRWQESKAEGKMTGLTLLDLSAAFDCLDADVLLGKMKEMGFDDLSQKWIKSYLSGRKQVVAINGVHSSERELKCGTPQGSCLSPLLYIILTSDIELWTSKGEVSGFADDTSLSIVGECEEAIIKDLELETENLMIYMASNNLVANPGKTAFMMLGKKSQQLQKIQVCGSDIKESETEKLLGLYISKDLSWDEHVNQITSTLNYRLYVLRKLSLSMDRKSLKQVAEGLIMSKIRYGLAVYGKPILEASTARGSVCYRLQLLQNHAMRTIQGLKKSDRTHIDDLLESTGFLSINQISAYSSLMEFWKIVNQDFAYLTPLIKGEQFPRDSRSKSKNHVRPVMCEQDSFPMRTAKLWNHKCLPDEFRTAVKRTQVKDMAKKFVKDNVPALPWK